MNIIKENQKSRDVDLYHNKKKKLNRRHSYDLKKRGIIEENSNISYSKFKKLTKNKFKNIPKNEQLMNFSTILHNNENKNNNMNNNNCLSIINDIFKIDHHLEHTTNIKKKLNENNLKISSLIPISKKRFNKSKQRTANENDNLIINILKKELKKTSKRRKSFLEDKCSKNSKISKHTKNSRSSKKKKPKRYNSSHELITINKDKENNIDKHIDNIISILKKDAKTRKLSKNEEGKNEENNIGKKEKDYKINEKNENLNEEKKIIFINNIKTKNEYEIDKSSNKEKRKKHKPFPFCCFTVKDGNSSDDN